MAQIQNEMQYNKVCSRIEELLAVVTDSVSAEDKDLVELDLLSALVYDYEQSHYKLTTPSLSSVLRYRMTEIGISQSGLAKLLSVSPSRISEYMTGKSEPTLKVARAMYKELHIDPSIILGV